MMLISTVVIVVTLISVTRAKSELQTNEWCNDDICLFMNHTKVTWEESYEQCVKYKGYLVDDKILQETWEEFNLQNTTESIIWVAMKKHNGYFQWMGQKPVYDGSEIIWPWADEEPNLINGGSCVVAITEQGSTVLKTEYCSQQLPFVCFVDKKYIGLQESITIPENIKVILSAKNDTKPLPEIGHIIASKDTFQNLSLHCSISATSITSILKDSLTIRWVKDGIYLNNGANVLQPTTVYDLTRTMSAPGTFYSRQGVYWCEAIIPGLSQTIQSNKILVQLANVLNILVTVAELVAFNKIPRSLGIDFPDKFIKKLTEEGINVSASEWDQLQTTYAEYGKGVLVTHTFYWYINLTNQDSTERLLEWHESNASATFKQLGYLKYSKLSFPTICLEDTVPLTSTHIGHHLTWKTTEDGMIMSSENGLCVNSHFQILTRRCQWNFPQANWSSLNADNCAHFVKLTNISDQCRENEQNINGQFCFRNTPSLPWNKAMEACARTGLEVSVLQINDDLLHTVQLPRQSWLPFRRLWPAGPLTYVGMSRNYFDLKNLTIPWEEGQPDRNMNCLAINTINGTLSLVTSQCENHFPSSCVLPIQKSKYEGHFEQYGCPERWISHNLIYGHKCYKSFTDHVNMYNWNEANEFCQSVNGTLVTIENAFMQNFVRKDLIPYLNVDISLSVWVNVINSNMTLYNNYNSVINPLDLKLASIIDWKAKYGVLDMYGTINFHRRHNKISSIICETVQEPVSYINISIHENATLLVTTSSNLNTNDYHCYCNGNPVDVLKPLRQQGYYQCHAFSDQSLKYVISNTILYKHKSGSIFIVKLLDKGNTYDPQIHDPTFENFKIIQANMTNEIQHIVEKHFIQNVTVTVSNISSSMSGVLEIYLHIELQCDGHVADIQNKLSKVFADNILRNGTLQAVVIRSNRWCPEDEVQAFPSPLSRNTLSIQRMYKWPATEEGRYAITNPPCENKEGKPELRLCEMDFNEGAYWQPSYITCEGNVSNSTMALWKLSSQQAFSAIEETADIIKSKSQEINFADVYYTVNTLERTIPKTNYELNNIAMLVNNLMKIESKTIERSQHLFNTSNRITTALERITFDAVIPNNTDVITCNEQFLSMQVWNLKSAKVVGFTSKSEGKVREINTLYENKIDINKDADAALLLPESFIEQTVIEKNVDNNTLRLSFVVYNDDKFFHSNTGDLVINSVIVQASLKDVYVKNIDPPVKIYFKPLRRHSNNTVCVFWDFDANNGQGKWSTEGCRYGGRVNGQDICYCNHLTCFAELVSYYGQKGMEDFDENHILALDIITLIGCSLSLLGQCLVFVTFILFKQWRKPLGNRIVMNLCFALFAVYILFLGGFNQTSDYRVCIFVSVALHYFITATFCWMLVEAIHQYLRFVKIVGTYIPRFMTKAAIGAWGFPSVLIMVVLIYNHELYIGGEKYCWMSLNCFYYTFMIPLGIIMITNSVIYGLIVRNIYGRPQIRSNQPKYQLAISQVRMAISVFILLGLTWIFGILAISDARLVFTYLFCILNTLQGFFIFLFHIMHERTSTNMWKSFLGICLSEDNKNVSDISSPLSSRISSGQDAILQENGRYIPVVPRQSIIFNFNTNGNEKPNT